MYIRPVNYNGLHRYSADIPEWFNSTNLRRAVVLVRQEPFLLTGSVADDIALGMPTAGTLRMPSASGRPRLPGGQSSVRRRPGRTCSTITMPVDGPI